MSKLEQVKAILKECSSSELVEVSLAVEQQASKHFKEEWKNRFEAIQDSDLQPLKIEFLNSVAAMGVDGYGEGYLGPFDKPLIGAIYEVKLRSNNS